MADRTDTLMTTDRRDHLQAVMVKIIDAKIVELVDLKLAGVISQEHVQSVLGDLTEIAACIGTAHRALNLGEARDLVAELRASMAAQAQAKNARQE